MGSSVPLSRELPYRKDSAAPAIVEGRTRQVEVTRVFTSSVKRAEHRKDTV